VKAANDEVKQSVLKLKNELKTLSREVDVARKQYVEFSGDLIAVDGPVKILVGLYKLNPVAVDP
jgi:hypothetical protein